MTDDMEVEFAFAKADLGNGHSIDSRRCRETASA